MRDASLISAMLLPPDVDTERIIDHIVELTNADRALIERATRATLAVLAAWAPERHEDALTFYRRIAEREESGVGVALEHAELVLRTAAEMLSDEQREHLLRHLPAEIERQLRAPARKVPRFERHHLATGHTLATGRPGSRHPVAEGRVERSQSHSVARSDHPHGDTQLSTTHGVKKAPNLAEGKPGSREHGD